MNTAPRIASVTMDDVRSRIAFTVREHERWYRAAPTAAGPDNVSTMDWFDLDESVRLGLALEALNAPSPVRLVELKKPGGGTRRIGIHNRADQAVLYALTDVLGPIIEQLLSAASVGFRPGVRMTETLLASIKSDREEGRYSGAVVDVKNCFDSLDHGHLDRAVMALTNVGVDPAVLDLVLAHVRVPYVRRDGKLEYSACGVRQGSALAPLLTNLFLDAVDRRVRRRTAYLGVAHVRYADDIRLPAKTPEATRKALGIVEEELHRVRLQVKEGTGRIYDLRNPENPCVWLGIAHDMTRIYPAPHALKKKAAKYAELLRAGVLDKRSLLHRLRDLARYYAGLTSEVEAERAVGVIHDLLEQQLGLELHLATEEDPIVRLRRQVRPRVARDTAEEGRDSVPPCDPARHERSGSSPSVSSSSRSSQSSDDRSQRSSVPVLFGVLRGQVSGRVDMDVESTTAEGGVHPSGSLPLVRPSTPSADGVEGGSEHGPESHRARRIQQQPLERVARLLDHSWEVRIYTGREPEDLRIEAQSNSGKRWVNTFRAPAARSATEQFLSAVIASYCRLAERGAGQVIFVAVEPVLAGYLIRGWRPRRPWNARALRSLFEAQARWGVPWAFRLPSGRLFTSGSIFAVTNRGAR